MTSRRTFLAQVGAASLLPWASERPDLILVNGNLITVDPARPRAQAIAIQGSRIVAVGTTTEIRALARAGTRRVDLGGKTVVPGFIDAHTHPAYSGRRHLRQVDCDLRSIGAIQAALRERAGRTAPGEWVEGFKYDDTKTAERRFLTREDLDQASTTHPIIVEHRGGHTAYVNSAALALAQITDQSPNPSGGRFERDPGGRLTGRLVERGVDPVRTLVPNQFTREDDRQAVKLISTMLAKTGITSAHDAYGTPDDLRAYQDARDAGDLGTRIYCLIGSEAIDQMIAAGIRTGFGDEWIRVGAMKATCDGSISERTARLSEPYLGRPQDFGVLVADRDELLPLVRKAHGAGWQIGIHANGDVGIDLVLGIYEQVQRETPRKDPRFRLEHCTVVNDDLVRRIRTLGAIPTPFSTYVYFHGEKMQEYGEARLERMFALRSFLDAGVMATLASDYPPGPFEPMMALQSMVTRKDSTGKLWGGRQRITVEEAIRVGTLHGAHASYEEHEKGSLVSGKLADLVVLGRDPLRENPESLITIPVERTMVGGRWVYES